MGNTENTEVSIKFDNLNSLGTSINAKGSYIGRVVSGLDMDNVSTITANAAAHEAIALEQNYKSVFQKMAIQEKKNLDNIGKQCYEMEESLSNYYHSVLEG
ncbi:type VII secretion effector, SACOL2603 family [Pseudobutyrivibrio sp. YE44]|uniref:TIGR04197 family type VII secretion effector n=1 Tax=Pseudobutyrivibrio sp. YE44 TaxID=1520802 RepID=UPI00088EB742|nr:TIGR04197 family type VII secretion effector [Pseudobutyrivibrio sp. YE44]SDB39834.1 type VII secretion effector, SACOL2603 family [Pseudobutyrivibrio sp. YE44]